MTHDKLERDWTDISSEEYRIYDFGVVKGGVRIDHPRDLHVSDSGGHRILDKEGVSHYIPSGWLHISWKADPPFVK